MFGFFSLLYNSEFLMVSPGPLMHVSSGIIHEYYDILDGPSWPVIEIEKGYVLATDWDEPNPWLYVDIS